MVIRNKRRIHTGGPRIVSTPQMPQAASTFNGVYMRPNIDNQGTVPAADPLYYSPDIWPNGSTPVKDFQNTLATTQSYQSNTPGTVILQMDNYIYVRGRNGASTNKTVNVTLYYAASSLIQHPSYWESNIIKTDQNNQSANITNLAPGAIGVADQTFFWPQVQPPSQQNDHYCLIAQFNDQYNSNPVPDVSTQLDMSALVSNNLAWGWHNLVMVSPPPGFNWSYNTGLNIPANFAPAYYYIYVSPAGYAGWSVSFQCSRNDSNNNPITLNKTLITGEKQTYGTTCYLEPGYNAMISVYVYNDNNVKNPPSGASMPLAVWYNPVTTAEYLEAANRGLVDWNMTRHLQKLPGVTPTAAVQLGQVTGQLTTTTASSARLYRP